MPRRSNRTFARSSGKRPNRGWSIIVDTANSIAGGSTKVLLGTLVPSNPGIDETVLRTVGMIAVKTDQVAATEQQEGAFGMIVVNDRAIAAGAASIPGPLTDGADAGWFVHVPFLNDFTFVSSAGFHANGLTNVTFDFKSKRIVEEGFQIALMVETTASSEGITFSTILRLLSMVRGTG